MTNSEAINIVKHEDQYSINELIQAKTHIIDAVGRGCYLINIDEEINRLKDDLHNNSHSEIHQYAIKYAVTVLRGFQSDKRNNENIIRNEDKLIEYRNRIKEVV